MSRTRSSQRQPLIPITATHPSLSISAASSSSSKPGAMSSSAVISKPLGKPSAGTMISISTSHKRPSIATPTQGQGRRKTSKTENGAVTTTYDDDEESCGGQGNGVGGDAKESQQEREKGNAVAGPSRLPYLGIGKEYIGIEIGGGRAVAATAASKRASPASAVLTPRVKEILHRDDMGTGKSPARRLFADAHVHAQAHSQELSSTIEGTDSPRLERGDVAQGPEEHNGCNASGFALPLTSTTTSASASGSTHRLAPSPPLFSASRTPTASPSTSAIHNLETANMASPGASTSSTAVLPAGYVEVDENGVRRSIHDPGFTVMLDNFGIAVPMPMPTPTASAPVSLSASPTPGNGEQKTTPATPTTPRKGEALSMQDKENVPPPRDPSSTPHTYSLNGSPKTPSSAQTAHTARMGSYSMPIADWSKGSSSSARSQSWTSEAEVDAVLSFGLTPSRYHVNSPSSGAGSGGGSAGRERWTPGHVRVKSKLAEEILRSPTRNGRSRGEGEKEREKEGEVTPGPVTRSRARGIRN